MFNFIKNLFQNKSSEIISKDISIIHPIRKTMIESYFVPAHEPRANSDVFNATRKHLIDELDTPCYICGIKFSTIKDNTQNLYGSSQMESHHFHAEWSMSNSIDWEKMKAMHPNFSDWDKINPLDQTTFKYFIDSVYNAMILCDVCHRGKNYGIHAIEYSIWIARKFVKKDFKLMNDVDNSKSMPEFVDDLD